MPCPPRPLPSQSEARRPVARPDPSPLSCRSRSPNVRWICAALYNRATIVFGALSIKLLNKYYAVSEDINLCSKITVHVEEGHVDGALVDNVAESGEDSEDEWNYYKGEGEREEHLPSEEPDEPPRSETPCQDNSAWESSSVDMNSSPLNPDAPVFVPGGVGSDVLLSESPRKPLPMDDIELPDVAQFHDEAVVRPAELLDLDNCDQLNGHHNISLEEKGHFNGNDKCTMDSLGFGFNVGIEPEKVKDSSLIQDFERIQKDTTDFCNIQVYQSHAESNPFAVEGNDELFERLKNKERDPMSMSFYQEKDDDTCERLSRNDPYVDLNAVQPLPDSDEEDLQTNGSCDNINNLEKENIDPNEQHLYSEETGLHEPNNDIIRFDERTDIITTGDTNFDEENFVNYNVTNPSSMQGFSNNEFESSDIVQDTVLQTDTPESHKLLFEQIPEIPDGKSSELGFVNDDVLDPSESEKDTRAFTPQEETSQDIEMESKADDLPCEEIPDKEETQKVVDLLDQAVSESAVTPVPVEDDKQSDNHLTECPYVQPIPSVEDLPASPYTEEIQDNEALSPEPEQGNEEHITVDIHPNSDSVEREVDVLQNNEIQQLDHDLELEKSVEPPEITLETDDYSPEVAAIDSAFDNELVSAKSPMPSESPLPAQSPLPSHSPLPADELVTVENTSHRSSPLQDECVEPVLSEEQPIITESLLPSESPLHRESPRQDISPAPRDASLPRDSPLPTESPIPTQSPLPKESPLPVDAPLPSESPVPSESAMPLGSPLPTEETHAPSISPAPEDYSLKRESPLPVESPVHRIEHEMEQSSPLPCERAISPNDIPIEEDTPLPNDVLGSDRSGAEPLGPSPLPAEVPLPGESPIPTESPLPIDSPIHMEANLPAESALDPESSISPLEEESLSGVCSTAKSPVFDIPAINDPTLDKISQSPVQEEPLSQSPIQATEVQEASKSDLEEPALVEVINESVVEEVQSLDRHAPELALQNTESTTCIEESVMFETESVPENAEPTTIEPAEPLERDLTSVDTTLATQEPTIVDSDVLPLESKQSTVDTELATTPEPEPVKLDTEPILLEPEPVTVDTESAVLQPETVSVDSYTLESSTQVLETVQMEQEPTTQELEVNIIKPEETIAPAELTAASIPSASPIPVEEHPVPDEPVCEMRQPSPSSAIEVAEEVFAQDSVTPTTVSAPAPDVVPDEQPIVARSLLVTDVDIGVPESHAQEICMPVTGEIRLDEVAEAASAGTPPPTPAVDQTGDRPVDVPVQAEVPLVAAAVVGAAAAAAAAAVAVKAKTTPAKKSPTTPSAKTTTPLKSATKATATRTSSASAPASAKKAAPTARTPTTTKPTPTATKTTTPSTRATPVTKTATPAKSTTSATKTAAPVSKTMSATKAPTPTSKPTMPNARPTGVKAPTASRPTTTKPAAAKPATEALATAKTSATSKTAPVARAPAKAPAVPRAAPAKPAPKPAATAAAAPRAAAPRPASTAAPKPRPATKAPEKKPLSNGDVKETKAPPRPISKPAAPATKPAPRTTSATTATKPTTKPPLDKQSKDLANKRITAKTAPPRTATAKSGVPAKSGPRPVPKKAVDIPKKEAPATNGLTNGADDALSKPPLSPPPVDNALLPDVIA